MMGELKVGDLCLVVVCSRSPRYIGHIVKLRSFREPQERYEIPEAPGRIFHNDDKEAAWLCEGEGIVSSAGVNGVALFLPRHLMKISGDEWRKGTEEDRRLAMMQEQLSVAIQAYNERQRA